VAGWHRAVRPDIEISPGANVEQAGLWSHPVTVQFADSQGQSVPLGNVTRLTIDSSLGERFTFSPAHPPQALAANRIVRVPAGLVPLPIRYSVRDVIIDGANVVYGGSQNFYVHKSRTWKVEILLFPLQVKVQDALFGFSIGSAVRLTLPNGSSRLVRLGPGHSVTLAGLPRATYQLVAEGPGFGLASPSTLSKPQVARILLLSWVDIIAVLAFVVLFLVGLPILGGRIVRRQGGIRLPVWHVGRSHELPQVAAPETAAEESAGGTPVPGPATEELAATAGQPGTAGAEDESISKEPAAAETAENESDSMEPAAAETADNEAVTEEPAATAAQPGTAGAEDESISMEPAAATAENEAVTEVFAAITDTPRLTARASQPTQRGGPRLLARHVQWGARPRPSATSPARPLVAGELNGSGESAPPDADCPASGRPVSPQVKLATWPTWKPGRL
jgi:hypothetical protein